MFFCVPLSVLAGYLRPFGLGRRNDVMDWANFMMAAFKVRVLKLGDGEPCREDSCIFLVGARRAPARWTGPVNLRTRSVPSSLSGPPAPPMPSLPSTLPCCTTSDTGLWRPPRKV